MTVEVLFLSTPRRFLVPSANLKDVHCLAEPSFLPHSPARHYGSYSGCHTAGGHSLGRCGRPSLAEGFFLSAALSGAGAPESPPLVGGA
jgi:hypothetical protein